MSEDSPLAGGDRALLHRVLGMLGGEPAYADTMGHGWTHVGPGKAGDLQYGDYIGESGRVMRVKMILINPTDANYRDVTLAEPGGTEHHQLLHVFDEVHRVEPTPETVDGMRAERRALYTRLVREHGPIAWESRGNDARGVAEDLDDLRDMAAEVEGQAPDPLSGIPAGYHDLARQAIEESLARAPALSGDGEAVELVGPEGFIHGAGLRAVVGDGSRPQERALTAAERADLGDVIRRLIEEWERPRLFREPTPAWDLTGAEIARLGLIWRAVSPPAEDPDSPVVVNAADWTPPDGIPDGWVIANAPQPIQGPAGARAWEGEERHGRFYAAWPVEDDDDVYWDASGAREVVLWSNQEMAASAGRYLAACGLLPGEGGLTATEVARRLRPPWKEGILDDEQVQDAALAAILEMRRDHEDQAYDFSDSPQRRELTGAERAFVSWLARQAAADPRWADEAIARHPGIRAALGDGTRPQRRPLTARERDDIARMVMLIDSDYRYDRQGPGYQPRWPWVAELAGGDVARLGLIDAAITPRRGDRAIDDRVFVNAADWMPPEPVPDGWVTACASVPLAGPVMWAGPDLGNGQFYAAAPPDDDPFDGWHAEAEVPVVPVKAVTDEEAVEAAYAFLASYQCTAPGDAGMTIAEVARDLGYPLPPARADAAVTAASTTWTLRASRGNGKARWYALHGTRVRDRIATDLASDGYQVTPATAIPPGSAAPAEASAGARAMVDLALRHGWDVAYVPHARGETVTAQNTDTHDGQVSQAWDTGGRLACADDLDKIGSRPRPRCAAAPGLPGPDSPGPAACEFPELPATTPPNSNRSARTRSQPASGRARRPGRKA